MMSTGPAGFIGLGVQGAPLAANLQAAGFDLMVFDLRQDALVAPDESQG